MILRIKISLLGCIFMLFTYACTPSSDDSIPKKGHPIGDPSFKPDGLAVFRKNCVTCHGVEGNLGLNGAKDLTKSVLTKAERLAIITNGKGMMTPFKALLSTEEIDAVAAYTITLKKE